MTAVADWWGRTGWLVRTLWLAGAIQLAYVTADAYYAYDARAWDFRWVFLAVDSFVAAGDPYDVYLFVNPPSALILLAPFAALGFTAAHAAFLALSAIAIVVAGFLCLNAAGLRWSGAAGAVVLLLLAQPSAVRSTLGLGNVNSLVVLCEGAALAAMLAGRWKAGGVALGLSFAIKPILVPLLVLPALMRRWRSVAIACALPIGLSALAIALNPDAVGFITDKLEFLWKGNAEPLQAGNVAILGAFENLSLPRAAGQVARFAVLALGLGLAWLRWRSVPDGGDEPDAGRRLRILEASGLLLLVTLLCFSFSWLYYGIYLLPLIVTIAQPGSLLRHPLAVAGLVLMLAPIGDTMQELEPGGFEKIRPTLSWLLMLAGMGLAQLSARSRGAGGRGARAPWRRATRSRPPPQPSSGQAPPAPARSGR